MKAAAAALLFLLGHLSPVQVHGQPLDIPSEEPAFLAMEERGNLTLRVRVMYPDAGVAAMYLGGGQQAWLGDGPRVAMAKAGRDTYVYDLKYANSQAGYTCHGCPERGVIRQGESLQLQVHRQLDGQVGFTRMLGPMIRISFPLSLSSTEYPDPPEVVMAPIFDPANGTQVVHGRGHPVMGERRVVLYLPPGLANPYKKVPLTVMLDLAPEVQAMFQPYLDRYFVGEVAETAILGFGDWKGATVEEYNDDRTTYMTPYPGQVCHCKAGTLLDLCDGCLQEDDEIGSFLACCDLPVVGGVGDVMLDWVEELVREVADDWAPGRLLTGRDSLGIMGYSLGGLMSCYAAWTRSSVYGLASCQSASFWWPRLFNATGGADAFQFIHDTLADGGYTVGRLPQKVVIDVGGEEATPVNNIVLAGRQVYDTMAGSPHFTRNVNLWYQVYPGERHSIQAWVKRMWNALKILRN